MPEPMRFPAPTDVNDLLEEPEPEYNWLVPGLLERGDRLILTGNEGKGKSTLLRQIGIQIAAGIHPFTLDPIEPCRVLLFDLENPRPQIRRELNKIKAERCIDRNLLRVESVPQGIDLSSRVYIEAMTELLSLERPDLLIIGPTYKMAPRLEDEGSSGELAFLLDQWRIAFGMTLLMESHQPHDRIVETHRQRPERPFGSSLWMRWPEFGLCLWDDGTLRHWRGARDENREWPERLRRGEGGEESWLWEVDNHLCLKCGVPLLGGKPRKFCSERCSNAFRQQRFKANRGNG